MVRQSLMNEVQSKTLTRNHLTGTDLPTTLSIDFPYTRPRSPMVGLQARRLYLLIGTGNLYLPTLVRDLVEPSLFLLDSAPFVNSLFNT